MACQNMTKNMLYDIFFYTIVVFFKINYFKNFILEKSNFKCTNLKVQITIFIINVN